jgi:hypothetical protein
VALLLIVPAANRDNDGDRSGGAIPVQSSSEISLFKPIMRPF